MIKVKVPATSANLGIGFDCLGLSLDLYNTFTFEASNSFKLSGFKSFNDINNNLVAKAYIAFAENANQHAKPVIITQVIQDIPLSRGLGSSAACIVAGVLASNHLNNLNKSLSECAAFAALYEGHPDNVYPAVFGGLVTVFEDDEDYHFKQYKVSENLNFFALIPNEHGNTDALRKALPSKLPYADAVFNLSRIIQLPEAIKEGDFKLLKKILVDKLHEPYRFKYLVKPELIEKLKLRKDLITLISGSGTTVLLISENDQITLDEDLLKSYRLHKVSSSLDVKARVK